MHMKLLIADDDKTFCHLLSAEIGAKGWRVIIAADAMQTIMYAMGVQPNVIVLDIQMTRGTGITALEKLKASTKTSGIPVLVVSGSTEATMESTLVQVAGCRSNRRLAARGSSSDLGHRFACNRINASCFAPTSLFQRDRSARRVR
jgi:CheY-like chemotaxis protein